MLSSPTSLNDMTSLVNQIKITSCASRFGKAPLLKKKKKKNCNGNNKIKLINRSQFFERKKKRGKGRERGGGKGLARSGVQEQGAPPARPDPLPGGSAADCGESCLTSRVSGLRSGAKPLAGSSQRGLLVFPLGALIQLKTPAVPPRHLAAETGAGSSNAGSGEWDMAGIK